jgi:hypothetical protein
VKNHLSVPFRNAILEEFETGHYLWWGVAPKRNVFRAKNFADPTIKKSKI